MLIRLGTRQSALALWQAETISASLQSLGHQVHLVKITTSGDIFITGIFNDTSALGQDTVYTNGCGDMFVRRIVEIPPLQSDTSDAVFSIVMPQYVSTDIDMGKVVVAKAKDSVSVAKP